MAEFQNVAFSLAPVEGLEAEPAYVAAYLRAVQLEADSIALVEEVVTKPTVRLEPISPAPEPPRLAQWQSTILAEFVRLKREIPGPAELAEQHTEFVQPRNASEWRKLVLESPPVPFSVLQQLEHAEVMRLVAHVTSWLSLSTNENLSRWIYCVLLRLDKVLDANDMALVRNLGKKAAKLHVRARDLGTAAEVARFTFELAVIVVGFYFDQRDIVRDIEPETARQ